MVIKTKKHIATAVATKLLCLNFFKHLISACSLCHCCVLTHVNKLEELTELALPCKLG